MNVFTEISLDQIRPHPDNRRVGGFDEQKMQQLAESIKTCGVMQPAVVRMIDGPGKTIYELVAGERRWRAARLAGLTTLPCVVRVLDDAAAMRIQIIENLQREDVHPLDEATGYQRLLGAGGYDVETIAKEVGRSASYVYQRLKLQDLIPAAREHLVKGTLTAGHAILIARLTPEQQREALEEAFDHYPSTHAVPVRELADWIQETILMDLGKAAFKKDDADLVPAAGPCTTCPKRTGYQPALFADVCKHDSCTDPGCFNGKLAALVARRTAELEGTEHLLVSDGYYERKAGILPKHDWEETRKSDKGAVRVLVANGPGRGRLTWGKKLSRGERYHTTPEEKAFAARRNNDDARKRAFRKRLLGDVMARVRADVTASRRIPTPLLRLVVADLTRKEIPEDANPSQLLLDLVEHVLGRDLNNTYWEPEQLNAAADLYKLDRKALEAEVRASIKANKSKKGKEDA